MVANHFGPSGRRPSDHCDDDSDDDGQDDDDENDGLGSHDLPAGTDRRHLFNSSTHNTRSH